MKIKYGTVTSGVLLMLLSLFIAAPAMAADTVNHFVPLSGSEKIAGLFGNFNSAALFLGGILAACGMLAGIAKTANNGELLDQRKSSLWVPIRFAIGIALLIPTSSGYCVAQQVIMTVAQSSVAAASMFAPQSNMTGRYLEADKSALSNTSDDANQYDMVQSYTLLDVESNQYDLTKPSSARKGGSYED